MSHLTDKVMRKVRFIYYVRLATERRALQIFFCSLSFIVLFSIVSVSHVLTNAYSVGGAGGGFGGLFSFFGYAFINTSLTIKITSSVLVLSLLLVAFDLLRLTSRASVYKERQKAL